MIRFDVLNALLRARYNLFGSTIKRKDFSDRKLVFSDDFRDLNNFQVKDEVAYNENPIWLSKNAVQLVPDGVSIKCWKETATHFYGKQVTTNWVTGMLDTRETFNHSNGLWVITAKVGNSWPAIWLLKRDRNVPGFKRTQITPEVDIMEVIRGKFRHTVHYGYEEHVYRTTSKGMNVCKWDDEFHEFAVDIHGKGYDFYIDGILTCKLRSNHPDFVTDHPSFLILNNASHPYTTDESEMIIKSVRVYE